MKTLGIERTIKRIFQVAPIARARIRKMVSVSQVSVGGAYQLAPPIPLYLLSYHPLPPFLLLVCLKFSAIPSHFHPVYLPPIPDTSPQARWNQ